MSSPAGSRYGRGPRPGARIRGPLLPHHVGLNRLLWVSAILLAPWIVILWFSQPVAGRAHDVEALVLGISAALIVGMLLSARLSGIGSPYAAMTLAATGVVAFIGCWFRLITRAATTSTTLFTTALLILPAIVLCGWQAIRLTRRNFRGVAPLSVRTTLTVIAIILIPMSIVLASLAPSVQMARHLRLVWTGLDVFELAGLFSTAWALSVGSRSVVVAGSCTGTLLCCDAWFNVISATGFAQLTAIGMACVEVPLAAITFAIAHRATTVHAGVPSTTLPQPERSESE
jgi:hypothetical protein